MCYDFEDLLVNCVKFIQPIAIAVLLVTGVPLWVIGYKRMGLDMWDTLIPLPLITNCTFPIDKYYIAQKSGSELNDSLLIDIPINSKQFEDNDIYILHNAWGFDIQIQIELNGKIQSAHKTQNLDLNNSVTQITRYPIQEIPDFGDSLKRNHISDNTFYTYCPYSTEITDFYRISSTCKERSIPMKYEGLYSVSDILPSFEAGGFDRLSIEFIQSYFIPYTYNENPEGYILFAGGNNSKAIMYHAGISLTCIAIILFVISIIFDFIGFLII